LKSQPEKDLVELIGIIRWIQYQPGKVWWLIGVVQCGFIEEYDPPICSFSDIGIKPVDGSNLANASNLNFLALGLSFDQRLFLSINVVLK
jgi:hypothetical protein